MVANRPSATVARTGTGRVVGIDALRMLAALAVFVCHVHGYWPPTEDLPAKLPQFMELLAHGVDVFIVLSGFVLTLPFAANEPILIANFLKRRALRLLPPYYVALLLAAILAMGPLWSWVVAQPASVSDLAWYAAMLQTFNPAVIGTINGSLWSVALDAQLYLLFPFALMLVRKQRAGWLIGGAVVVSLTADLIGATRAFGMVGAMLTDDHGLFSRFVQFAAGVVCAVWVRRHRPARAATIIVVAGASAVLAAVVQTYALLPIGANVLWAIPSAATVLLIASHVGPALARTPLERFGKASYSFYLIHQPVLLVAAHLVLTWWALGAWAALGVAMTVVLLITAGLAFLLYRGVERPCHEFGRRRFRVTPLATLQPSAS